MARLAALYVSGWDNEGDTLDDTVHSDNTAAAESSAWAASRQNSSNTSSRKCTACGLGKPLFDTYQAPCEHFYCQECIQNLFELSAIDETLFPPRCCRMEIPLQSAKIYLSSVVVQTFEEKSIEFQTLDRTYCAQPTCSSFIAPTNITGEHATCPKCGTHTCTICKDNAHGGDCPQDSATQQVLETAGEHGWQRCYNCRSLVELDYGCYHIVCRCKAQFCYVCGERWKTCRCDQCDEDRLLARAHQVVARRPPRVGAARERQVDRAITHLRERHECTHETWNYTAGPHQCEECYHQLSQYIFECQQCRILACNRCKMNRL